MEESEFNGTSTSSGLLMSDIHCKGEEYTFTECPHEMTEGGRECDKKAAIRCAGKSFHIKMCHC